MAKTKLEDRVKALELFRQGYGHKYVSTTLNLNVGTVQNWHLLYRGGDQNWATSQRRKNDPEYLLAAVQEYLTSSAGYKIIATKYGLSPSTILRGKKNYLNYGQVRLKPGRRTMKDLAETKNTLKNKLQHISNDDGEMTKKDIKELIELLEVNIALLEVLEESDPNLVKKNEYRQQRKQLEVRLAYARRAYSCM